MGDQEQEARARARIGTTVRNKYRIDSLLGMGGMAVVYVATHRNQMEFAIKMLHPELSMSGDLKTRFLREGYAANSVKHPGVVQVVDDDVAEDGSAFLVMERLHGAGLDSLCEKHGVLGVSDAMGILDQLLDVLGAAHDKNIVHRDIKPANLFLTRDGTLKVLDFGIARARDAMATGSGATGTGVLMGTPAFMAPEQALAKTSEIDGRTDLWAAGATLFTLVVGSFVHQGDNAPQLLVQAATTRARSLATALPTAHPAVVDFVDHSLAFERESRFPNAAAMQAALRAAHQLAFGALPPRQSLATLVGGGSTRPAPITPFIAVTQALPSAPTTGQANGPSPTAAVVGQQAPQTTMRGIAAEPSNTARRSPMRLWIGGAVVALSLLGGGALALSHFAGTHTPPPTTSSAPIQPVVTVATTPTVAPAASSAVSAPMAPSASSTASAHAVAGAHVAAPKPSGNTVNVGPKPSASAATSAKTAPSATAPNCNPNYYFDHGVKHFKEECPL